MHRHRAPARPVWIVGLAVLGGIVGFAVIYGWPSHAAQARPPTGKVERSLAARVTPPGLVVAEIAAAQPSEEAAGPAYHPRDPQEWQGMLVNLSMRALCEGATSCGLAAACLDGQCGPCETDAQCGSGEVCVLDHCLLRHNVQCRSRRDCTGDEALCVLSGYSSDPRGNGELRASCLVPQGGTAPPGDVPLARGIPAPPPEVDGSALLESVRAQAAIQQEAPRGAAP